MSKILIVLAAMVSGGAFWLADRAVNDLPPRINVDGRLLRVRVLGEGSPAVVLEIGLGGPLEVYDLIQEETAKFTKVFAYDRIGAVEISERLTGEDVARELRAALREAGVEPPFVLVGHSFGGIYNRIFASLYPQDVAGMVLLDPTKEEFLDWVRANYPKKQIPSPNVAKNSAEGAGIVETLRQIKEAGPPPDVPVFVVTGTKKIDDPERIKTLPAWIAAHQRWANSQPQGKHVLAPESGHGVQVEAPELVVELVRQVVDRYQYSQRGREKP